MIFDIRHVIIVYVINFLTCIIGRGDQFSPSRYECININIPPVNILIAFAFAYEYPNSIIFFNDIHPITLKITDIISDISENEKKNIFVIFVSSGVFMYIIGIKPDIPIIRASIFFYLFFLLVI